LPALVADLIHRPVAVIAGDNVLSLAAEEMTSTVPILVVTAADPVRSGLVASLNRPSGNVTGMSFFGGALRPLVRLSPAGMGRFSLHAPHDPIIGV
jgi:putative ABC transport system substrate-binding protein